MRAQTFSCVAVLATCYAFAASACETPAMIQIPDGKNATMEQLLAAQAQVKTYMAAMNDLLACIDNETEAKGEDAPEQFKALMVTRHNAAVTEMETVASAFNDQVKAYKTANPTPAPK
jgi:tRNA C32,U32 (ribose-2'-O)-methylase TrmJ